MMTSDRPFVEIACDGSCWPNPGPGGWGVVLVFPAKAVEKELSGFDPSSTNNRMELLAAIRGLQAIKQPCRIRLFSDSQYVVKGMTVWRFGWNRSGKKIKNPELWEVLIAAAEPHQIEWVWVRGHDGHALNERADALAGKARLLAGRAA